MRMRDRPMNAHVMHVVRNGRNDGSPEQASSINMLNHGGDEPLNIDED